MVSKLSECQLPMYYVILANINTSYLPAGLIKAHWRVKITLVDAKVNIHIHGIALTFVSLREENLLFFLNSQS